MLPCSPSLGLSRYHVAALIPFAKSWPGIALSEEDRREWKRSGLSLLAYSMGSDAFVRGVRAASTSNQPSLQRAARILSDPSDHVDGREDGNES